MRIHELIGERRSDEEADLAKAALSGLLGGIMYNFLLIHRYMRGKAFRYDTLNGVRQVVETEEFELFTDTPSRTKFPRGFYWDSGFHNLVIQEWDWELSMDIVWSWIQLIDADGWIGREQMPGPESRENVPVQLRIQNPKYANPPTMLLPLMKFLERAKEGNMKARKFINTCYPHIKRNIEWFLRTQYGTNQVVLKEGGSLFRWRGRSKHYTLTSGLDDYPRDEEPNDQELHVDLACWMVMTFRCLSELAEFIEIWDDYYEYWERAENTLVSIEKHHWNETRGYYQDLAMRNGKLCFVDHFGYVSIMPLILGIMRNTERESILWQQVETKLLTDYGVGSLWKEDSFYRKGDQYWTGPIWINMNYMLVQSLKEKGYRKEAQLISQRVISNMARVYKETGYVWEQYSEVVGEGQRSHPFTGWSSLVLLMMKVN